MSESFKDIQLQYEGFLKTPLLWKNNTVFELQQFEVTSKETQQFNKHKKTEIRLGKRVEQFTFFTFQQDKSIKIVSENLQIQDGKRTVGEIDCLLLKQEQPFHIEIVYKFYLYDKTVGTTEIEHWIGPNRRDSFHQKLTKLKQKQLPLLQSKYTNQYLERLKLPSESIEQNVFFKAQLFVPLATIGTTFPKINNNCIYGFYIFYSEIEKFKNCKFYIPTKVDWLKEVQTNCNWLNYETFKERILVFLNSKSAPLCWLKEPNGNFQKFFVVWWNFSNS
ncbi:DUF1853 family protein [Lutibacter holmesii]|uniref:DUF1853 family protein n=1 Tax=Lutibacter holmesii TaxID=1137985 RepID=A0ABW3WPJ9_9FLAO